MPAKGQVNPAIRDEFGNIIPWKKRNREAANATTRALRASKPEEMRAQNRKYREGNPYGTAVRVAECRAKILGVKSTLTRQEWEEVVREANFKCHVCGKKVSLEISSPLRLSLDHIEPMSRGGDNVKSNVAPAHRICNQSRNSMTLEEFDDWLTSVVNYRGLNG
jgi:5-methylcytosine-specific restriction endonuclease McrA